VDLDRDPLLVNVLRGEYPIQSPLRRARRNHARPEHAPLPSLLPGRCQVDKCSENRGLAGRDALHGVFHDDMQRHALFKIMPFQRRPGDRGTGQHPEGGNAQARRAGLRPGRSGTRRGRAIGTLRDGRNGQDRQRDAGSYDSAEHPLIGSVIPVSYSFGRSRQLY